MESGASRGSLPDARALGTERFVLERDLGEGSMGSVYLAYDTEKQARVALKTLRRVDASGIYRFKREFRALADVSHPNLVQLYELFSSDKEWFFTMEYVQGEDFLSYVLGSAQRALERVPPVRRTRQGGARGSGKHAKGLEVLFPTPLAEPARLRDVLRQVTEGLVALHSAGKLHRDLKPDNVVVTSEGRAVLLDFGVAFELHQDAHGTLEGGVMGTPAYMSPEQAQGAAVSEATDYYALGVMLYEALTGQMPFDGSYMEVLRQKQHDDPVPPSELCSEVPAELEALAMRLLSRDPAARPTGSEILAALGAEPRVSRPSHPPRRSDPLLFGREAQLGELKRALDATADGVPVVALIDGDTGMGKTTLVERFLDEAREVSRAVILSGRCYEHEMVPFKALDSVIDALSRYLGGLPPSEAAEVIPKDVHALSQLFPVLSRVEVLRHARRRGRRSPEPRALRRLAAGALKELLARIAMREPLVVFIDDLQWGDVDSARLIAELLTGEERPAILLVCTYRGSDRERSGCLTTLIQLVRNRPMLSVRELKLEPLSADERTELARRLLGPELEEQVPAVARESRGSPYLLTQLVEHVRSARASLVPGDPRAIEVSLERALEERLRGLSAHATSVLELVAVSGRPVRDEVVTAVISSDLDLASVLTELRRARVLRGVGVGTERAIAIYDEGIRSAVLARMDEGLVRNWHRRLALAIESSREPDLEALTEHLIGAEDFSRAGIYAIRAASQAMAAFAFDKAAGLYEVAARYHSDDAWRQELLQQYAEALVMAGRSTPAAEAYLCAAERAPEPAAATLRRKAGEQLLRSGRWQRGAEILAPTLSELGLRFPQTSDEALAMSSELLPKLYERGLDFVPKAPADVSARSLERADALWAVLQATFASNPIVAQPFSLRYVLDAYETGDRSRVIIGLCAYFLLVDMPFSNIRKVRPRALQAAETIARDVDDPRCAGWLAFARASSYQNDGLLKPAALSFAQAEQIFRERCTNALPELRACRIQHARLLSMLAEPEELTRCRTWIREAEESEDLLSMVRLRLAIVPLLLLEDDVAQASRMLEVTSEVSADAMDLTALMSTVARTALALYRADTDEAAAVVARNAELRRSPLFGIRLWRSDFNLQRARLLLFLASRGPLTDELLTDLEKTLARIEGVGLECHIDHVRVARAALSHLRGERERAIELLDAIVNDADTAGEGRFVRACARLRKGQIVGSEVGGALFREADEELHGLGVRNTVSFARMIAPGFE